MNDLSNIPAMQEFQQQSSNPLRMFGARELAPDRDMIKAGIGIAQHERQQRDLSKMRATDDLISKSQEERAAEKHKIYVDEKLNSKNRIEKLNASTQFALSLLGEDEEFPDSHSKAFDYVKRKLPDLDQSLQMEVASKVVLFGKEKKSEVNDLYGRTIAAGIANNGGVYEDLFDTSKNNTLPIHSIDMGVDKIDQSLSNFDKTIEGKKALLKELEEGLSGKKNILDGKNQADGTSLVRQLKDSIEGTARLRDINEAYSLDLKELHEMARSGKEMTPELKKKITDLAESQFELSTAKKFFLSPKPQDASFFNEYLGESASKMIPVARVDSSGEPVLDFEGNPIIDKVSYKDEFVKSRQRDILKQYQGLVDKYQSEGLESNIEESEKPKGFTVETQNERIEREKKDLSKISPTVASLDKSILGDDYDKAGNLSKIKEARDNYKSNVEANRAKAQEKIKARLNSMRVRADRRDNIAEEKRIEKENQRKLDAIESIKQKEIKTKKDALVSIEKSMDLIDNEGSSFSEYKSKSESDIINNLPKLGDDIEKIKPKLAEIYQEMRGDYRASADIITQYFEENPDMTEEKLMGKFILGNRSGMAKDAIKRKKAIEENIKKLETYLK
jgi:hypothetical protein